MKNIIKTWSESLVTLEKKLGTPTYEVCLKNTCIHSLSGNLCVITVANLFAKNWLEEKEHKELIQSTLSSKYGEKIRVNFVISPQENKINKEVKSDMKILHRERDKEFLSGVYFFNEAENTIEIIDRNEKKIFGVKDGKIMLLTTMTGEIDRHVIYNYTFPEDQ